MPNGEAPNKRYYSEQYSIVTSGIAYTIVVSGIQVDINYSCKKCGDILPTNAKHCISCGAKVPQTGKTERL